MAIEDRNLQPGTRLVARHKKRDRTCEVVRIDDGIRYRLDDGTEHKSPSSAGKAVVGHACNGWVFWSLAGAVRAPRRAKAEPKTKAAKASRATKGTKPGKQTRGKRGAKRKVARAAAKSQTYGCGACGESFPTMKAATEHALTHAAAD